MEKTAVEWLAKELESYGDPQICKITWEDLDYLVNQAKAMEKEQIIDAAADHCYPTCELARIDAEEYYNETFKTK